MNQVETTLRKALELLQSQHSLLVSAHTHIDWSRNDAILKELETAIVCESTPSPTPEKLAREIDDLYEAPSRIRRLRHILEREFGASRSVTEAAKEISNVLRAWTENDLREIESILSRFREHELREIQNALSQWQQGMRHEEKEEWVAASFHYDEAAKLTNAVMPNTEDAKP